MKSLFDPDSKVMRLLGRMGDLMILNLLWLFLSAPILTVGAATVALYTVTMKIVRNQEFSVLRDFFRAFRSNWKQSTVIWLLLIGALGFLRFDLRLCRHFSPDVSEVMCSALYVVALWAIGTALYAIPMVSIFNNKTGNIIKNSATLAIAKLPYTITILFFSFVPILVIKTILVNLWGLFFVVIIGVALCALINSWFLFKIFAPWLGEDASVDSEEAGKHHE